MDPETEQFVKTAVCFATGAVLVIAMLHLTEDIFGGQSLRKNKDAKTSFVTRCFIFLGIYTASFFLSGLFS